MDYYEVKLNKTKPSRIKKLNAYKESNRIMYTHKQGMCSTSLIETFCFMNVDAVSDNNRLKKAKKYIILL